MTLIDTLKTRNKQQGFTLFEFVFVILLIGVMMSFAIDRLLQLQVDAERVSVQQVIGALKSAVNLQAAEVVVSDGLDSIRSLENTNPMSYLSELPYNYLGLKNDADASDHSLASWYYDTNKNLLVYKVKNTNYFATTLDGTPRIRLRVTLVYKDEVSRGRNAKVRGIGVKSLNEYNWIK